MEMTEQIATAILTAAEAEYVREQVAFAHVAWTSGDSAAATLLDDAVEALAFSPECTDEVFAAWSEHARRARPASTDLLGLTLGAWLRTQ